MKKEFLATLRAMITGGITALSAFGITYCALGEIFTVKFAILYGSIMGLMIVFQLSITYIVRTEMDNRPKRQVSLKICNSKKGHTK